MTTLPEISEACINEIIEKLEKLKRGESKREKEELLDELKRWYSITEYKELIKEKLRDRFDENEFKLYMSYLDSK
ncbi:MAG: hypothetical protein QXE64_01530 [Candidatus Pacearchaeota archaeon]